MIVDDKSPMSSCRLVTSFAKGNKLGEGTYGSVYEARDKDSGALVALKRVKEKSEAYDREGIPTTSLREVALLRRLSHPNIVTLLEVAVGTRADSVFLVFEHCEHELARLVDSGWRMSLAEAKCAMQHLLCAVAHLHANFILHRDLKLSNLLLTRDGALKLCDFGLAREAHCHDRIGGAADMGDGADSSAGDDDHVGAYTPKVVTLWYRAPELLLGATRYGCAVDMWSCGCIMGECLLHRPLLPGSSEKRQLELICLLLGTPSEAIWPELPRLALWAPLKATLPRQPYNDLPACFAAHRGAPHPTEATLGLLNGMLTFNPARRLSAVEALRHAWFVAEAPLPTRRIATPVAPPKAQPPPPPPPQQQQRHAPPPPSRQGGERLDCASEHKREREAADVADAESNARKNARRGAAASDTTPPGAVSAPSTTSGFRLPSPEGVNTSTARQC